MPINRSVAVGELEKVMRTMLLTGLWMTKDLGPSDATLRGLWTEHRPELEAQWVKENGLFSRCWAWWEFGNHRRRLLSGEAGLGNDGDWFGPPSAGDAEDYETQFSFLRRHPKLQTAAERAMKLNPATIRWRSMPCSEMTDIEDFQRYQNYRDLLSDDELAALQEHLALTGPELSGRIQ